MLLPGFPIPKKEAEISVRFHLKRSGIYGGEYESGKESGLAGAPTQLNLSGWIYVRFWVRFSKVEKNLTPD